MGMCVSCESPVAPSTSPAKVILSDGGLLEFLQPVMAAHVLEKHGPSWIVCDADGMEFDEVVSAVADQEELRPGQLYFVLPSAMLDQPLQAEEMAALAVKASAALVRSGRTRKGKFRCGAVVPEPLLFDEPARDVKRLKRGRGKGVGRNFVRSLSVIQE